MSPAELICSDVSAASDQIGVEVRAATSEQLMADSRLSGWDRAHVVAHIAGFSHGMARQLEYALRGEQIEQYTGGMLGRNTDIDERAALPAAELKGVLEEALDRLAAAIAAMAEADWVRSITYRQGTARSGLEGAWRELTIHGTDLDLGSSSAQWSDTFCAHLFKFLALRLPAEIVLVLADGTRLGGGTSELYVTGSSQDVAAWLAGREPVSPVTFSAGVPPVLGPWPSTER